ncbi:9873_t:CDS:2 [Gigaspora margarita]|uniref:9873_t:CDS:1 n=1 Tax=Gigaspora margarita TaxID=4874 RepID=A0ABN7VXE2_GIGMA|nr:9873_t:CDS:2 [Gigaspora margarita]
MSSELESLKRRITELEAENAELRKENTEIPYLRNKLSVSDAEIAELKRMNIEFLRANEEYNERRDAENAKLKAENAEFRDRFTKVEQNQTRGFSKENDHPLNDNSSNNSSVAVPEYDPVTLKKNKGIGWHMVQRVTCSADRISRLTNPQIEYIIEQVKSKTITSHVNEISETMANTSANGSNSDDPKGNNSSETTDVSDEDDFEKMIMKAFEEDEARIEKERQNEMSTNVVTPAKADNYNDVYFDEEDLKEEEGESNEVKSDDENDSSNSEEEMPDESDDDGYSGCGGYNEYGESDRGYYYDLSSGKKTSKILII